MVQYLRDKGVDASFSTRDTETVLAEAKGGECPDAFERRRRLLAHEGRRIAVPQGNLRTISEVPA